MKTTGSLKAVAYSAVGPLYGEDRSAKISFLRVNSNFVARRIHQRNPAREMHGGARLHDNMPSNSPFCRVNLLFRKM